MNRLCTGVVVLLLAACRGEQSALVGAGEEAARISQLTWLLVAGAVAITALVVVLTLLALAGPARWRRVLAQEKWVVAGGVIFPTVVLSGLLIYGFILLRPPVSHTSGQGEVVRIHVVGEQWWWRVIYHHEDGTTTETANEVRFPVGRPVELALTSADVIHSFWLPAYAGKVDMIPGRTNYLRFTARQPGVARGQCAEYCGGAHALMAFYGVALPADEYAAWLVRERREAVSSAESEGAQLFLANGCGACHAVRGTPATGTVGPDLTHIGGRLSIGAGIVTADHAGFTRWIRDHQRLKPENLMPPYEILADAEVQALAAYLVSLE